MYVSIFCIVILKIRLVQPDDIPLPAEPGQLPLGKMSRFALNDIDRFLQGAGAV